MISPTTIPTAPLSPHYPGETPAAVIELEYLPSLNDREFAARSSFNAGAEYVKKWRRVGRDAVCCFAERNDCSLESCPDPYDPRRLAHRLKEVFFDEPIEIVIRVWRPDAGIVDVQNFDPKAVIDGFVDCQLLRGDDCRYVRGIKFWYEGIDRSLAFTPEERERREALRVVNEYKRARRGKKPNLRLPVRSRFRMEFYSRPRAQAGLFQ